MEIELKLGPAGKDVALALYNDTDLLPPAGAEEVIPMKTIYYDTPDRDFAARKETLRLRQEGDRSVCCFKTALQGLSRLEAEQEAATIEEGAARLSALAELPPEAAAALKTGVFVPVCGAAFTRRTRLCRAEGALFHLCLDEGQLLKGPLSAPLCEIELELCEGEPAALERLEAALTARYGLPRCALSKQQRAMALEDVR